MRNKNSMRSVLVLFALFLGQLACGSSTVDQLSSAMPATRRPSNTEASSADRSEATSAEGSERATPTGEPEPIRVGKFGFGQDGQQLGYAFLVDNPNESFAYERSQYQIAAYDKDDTVLKTDTGYIQLILPAQTVAIAGSMYLDEGMEIARIEVQLNAGDPTFTEFNQTFGTEKVVFQKGEYFQTVLGVVENPFAQDLTSLWVYAVAYDGAGEIIGGGSTIMNFVLANSKAGVEVNITANGKVAKVELYPSVSGLSTLLEPEKPPEGAKPAALQKSGFGQEDNQVGYGMIVHNPNSNFAVERTMYHMTFFDEAENVVAVEEGYLQVLLPNQTLGLGGNMYLEDGQNVGSADIQILSMDYVESDILPFFTSDKATFLPDNYFPKVTGIILNPYTKDISNLRVSAIAFNDADEIIGGGYTFLSFIPANGKAAVEVSIVVKGKPSNVELYAAVSGLSEFE